ncbi:MAG: hypothetical protein U1E48_05290 [Paracoccaceae bacterium]
MKLRHLIRLFVPLSRRELELAYLNQSVSRYDLERREKDIQAGLFAGY